VSNHRWIVGGKLCLLVNQYGLVVEWACDTANVADNTFQWLMRQFEERMIVLSDTAFHAAEGDPTNLKLCERGAWEDRLLVETVLSMLTLVCHLKPELIYYLAVCSAYVHHIPEDGERWRSGAAHDVHAILQGLMESVALAIKDGAVVKHEDGGVFIDLFRIPQWFYEEVVKEQQIVDRVLSI
jgi:hypothetical protein